MRTTIVLPVLLCGLLVAGCQSSPSKPAPATAVPSGSPAPPADSLPLRQPLFKHPVTREVKIRDYFPFIDSVVRKYDSLTPYRLSEHLLVRANPWLIDTLEDTDYYRMKARGIFVYDQRQLTVLHPGDTLLVPDTLFARELQSRINKTWLDINIPEFKLRVVEDTDTLYCMTVRIGQNKKRFQEAIGRVLDLRTQTGVGKILRINRAPSWFIDPHTGERFTHTKRDDGRTTRMPIIPWLEPEINGVRLGQMIHPTTNPETLGRAYSNGCVGCRESDAWRLYYYAPEGTKVVLRYDLDIATPEGDTIHLPDVYERRMPADKPRAKDH